MQRFLDDWLRGKRNLRDTTRRNYETHVRRYLTPALGHYRLDALRADHIDTLYNDLMNGRYTGTGTATVHHVHRTLRSALNTALKRRLIQWNPALQVELPEHRRAETTVWEPQQIAGFLDACSHHRLYALFHVLTFTGMRRGEAIGTHWKDVDLDRGHITVRSQVIDAGAGPKLGAPKTHAGARVVPIDAATVDVLREHRERQQRERRSWGDGYVDHGLVFARDNGDLLRPDAVTHLFIDLVRKAGVPVIRLHDLRHTHASLALAAGIDVKIVSARLGHSTSAITRDLYMHVVPELARTAADTIAAAVAYSRKPDVVPMWSRQADEGDERAPPEGKTAGQAVSRQGDLNP
ncbi:site-specific integrase [Kineococcus sp. TRM81007]|uniref:tyrosine-type recombinase/integrase n=1 Tax=Kineococcus sp. TRM81007 TaxID=2925831 RepID=UPI001F5A208C|nr:site-specific integrase [Kineococcus sp. TRM81007]MCI2238080.1 site-specific integrase [Kineococcus sp. TRM81007]